MTTTANNPVHSGAQHGGGRHRRSTAQIHHLHSGYARHIGRVGVLAVALGIGAAVASTPGVAWADDGTTDTTKPAQDSTESPGSGTTGSTSVSHPDLGAVIRHNLDSTADTVRKVVTGVVHSSGGALTSTLHTGTPVPSGTTPTLAPRRPTATTNRQTAATTNTAPSTPAAPQQLSQAGSNLVSHATHAVQEAAAGLRANTPPVAAALTPTPHTTQNLVTAPHLTPNFATTAVTPQATAAPQPNPVVRVVSGLLAAIGITPGATNSPVAPISGPTLLGALALIRRELEHTFTNQAPQLPATTSLTTDNQHPAPVTGLPATDGDGDVITYSAPAQGQPGGPQHGTVTVDGNHVTYTSDTGYVGDDTFTLTASDANSGLHLHSLNNLFNPAAGHTDTETVTVHVTSANLDPPALPDPQHPYTQDALHEGDPAGTVRGHINAQDPQGLPVTYSPTGSTTTADGSTLTVNSDGSFVYTPNDAARHAAAADNAAQTGADKFGFTVTATNSRGATADIPVSVPVGPTLNQAPAAGTPSTPIVDHADGAVTSSVGYTDADHDSLHYSNPAGGTETIWATTKGGTVTVDPSTGEYKYTPDSADRHAAAADDAAQTGADTDSFTVVVSDGHGSIRTVTVSVPITPTNEIPTAPTNVATPSIDHSSGAVTSTVGYTDPDRDALHYSNPAGGAATSWTTAKGGKVTVDADTGAYTYVPEATDRHPAAAGGTAATDSFAVTISDGHGSTQTVTVRVPIDPTNQALTPPETTPQTTTYQYNGAVVGPLGYTDLDNDQLTYTGPENGKTVGGGTVLVNSDGTYYYVPDPADRLNAYTHPEQNTDSFDVTITDGHGSTQTVTVHVMINPTDAAITQVTELDGVATAGGGTTVGPDGSTYTSGYRRNEQGSIEPVVMVVNGTTGQTQYIAVPSDQQYAFPAGPVKFGPDGTPYQTWYDSDGTTGETRTSVSRIDTVTGTATLVGSAPGFFDDVKVGPDGTLYLRTTTTAGEVRDHLWVMKPNGGAPVDVVPSDHPYWTSDDLVLAPNGTAYQTMYWYDSNSGYHSVVLIIDKDTGEATPVAFDGFSRGGVAIDRNGTVYQVASSSGGQLWSISSDGHATPVPGDVPYNPVSVGPDGAVYYASAGYNQLLVDRIDPGTHEVSQVARVEGQGMRPSQEDRVVVGSNGLIYVNTYDGSQPTAIPNGMTIIDPRTGASKTVHYGGDYLPIGDPDVSPDGTAYQRLAHYNSQGEALAVVDPATGAVTVVPLGDSFVGYPGERQMVFGPDGTAYYSTSNVVVVVDPSTHTVTPVYLPGLASGPVSIGPDGKAYQAAGGQTVVISVAEPPTVDSISM